MTLLEDLKQTRDRLMFLWQAAMKLASRGEISEEAAKLIGDAWDYLCEAIYEIEEKEGDEDKGVEVTFREYSNSVTMIVDGRIFRHLTVGDILPDGRTVESKEQAKAVLLEWFEKGIAPVYDGSKRWAIKEG